MKWYVATAVIVGGLNSVLASVVFSLAAFHLFSNKSTNAPLAQNDEWIALVRNLVAFAGAWMAIAVVGIFVSMSRKSTIALPTVVLLLYALCLGGSIYFTLTFGKQLDMKEVQPETLFKKTIRQINNKGSQTWIPTWLDNIQKKSKQCCGVITYHDYEDFWPNTPTKIPRSCCRDRKSPMEPCPSDLTKIPYPDTPAIYFKVETGCMNEINEATRRNVLESYYNSMTMSIVIGIGLFILLIAYVKQYLSKDKDTSKDTTGGERGAGAGDAAIPVSSQSNNLIADSEALMIDSNGQMIASIDSIQPLASYDSMPPPQIPFQQQSPQVSQQQQPIQASSTPPQSSTGRFNKVNAVFAGLQQTSAKFPEASTGDDMTVGGSNMSRKEVFVAQDNMPTQQMPPSQSNQQQPQQQNVRSERANFASSSSGEEFGDDVIRDDQDPDSGGQTSGRKKKGKKHKRRNSNNDS